MDDDNKNGLQNGYFLERYPIYLYIDRIIVEGANDWIVKNLGGPDIVYQYDFEFDIEHLDSFTILSDELRRRALEAVNMSFLVPEL